VWRNKFYQGEEEEGRLERGELHFDSIAYEAVIFFFGGGVKNQNTAGTTCPVS